ncbi:MAG: hypothetical protein ABSA23_09580 [Anaerolineales bacterium]
MAIPFLTPPSVTPRPPLPARRRGGQPSNRNALRHGFYSRHHPASLTKLTQTIGRYRQIEAQGDPVVLARAIPGLHKQIDVLDHVCTGLMVAGNVSLFIALHKLALKAINTSVRYKLILHKRWQPFRDLQFVAGHALDLIAYDFWEHRITRDADSFRSDTQKSDLNSIPSGESLLPAISEPDFPFLSPPQWQLLQPLLPALSLVEGPAQPAPVTKAPASSLPLQGEVEGPPSPNPQDWGRGRG